MLNQFYISFEKDELDSFSIKHIQYNIQKRLQGLKYVSYRRMDIVLVDEKSGDVEIEWDDKKTANIKCYYDPLSVVSITDKNGIAALYLSIFKCLESLWVINHWNIEDLKHLHREIEKEDFISLVSFGKQLASPDKKHKAEFFCELHPSYADYYLYFVSGKGKGKDVKKIRFLHGHPDPCLFFGFFSNRIWRDNEYFLLSDINKEIFHIFNVNETGFSLEYRPMYNTLEECKNYVSAYQADISHSEMMRLLGFPIGR